ncbi:hypothetical protein [uncultured Muribaculum sp.]|nr:hypothetical protein [uncultured Muribaculum sp.]
MRYLIIGLGIYGSNLATDLTDMGHEVIGADHNPTLVGQDFNGLYNRLDR